VSPLLSAVRLAVPRLRALVGDDEPELRRTLEGLMERASGGEDVEIELLDVVRSVPSLRGLVNGLLATTTPRRSSGGEQEASPVNETRPPLHVNTVVAERGATSPLRTALAPRTSHEVRVRVGPPLPESLLEASDSEVTLPVPLGNGVWLRAVLDVDGMGTPVVAALFLDADGSSFSCGCDHGAPHHDSCIRFPWTVLPFVTPAVDFAVCTARLVVYRDAVAVHVQEIRLPVGSTPERPTARLIARLADTVADLDDLLGRSASIVVGENSSRLTVNGLGFTSAPFSVSPGAADTATLDARHVLYGIHVDVTGAEERNRYDGELSKPRGEFLADLAQLARSGAELYTRLFDPQHADPTTTYSLPALLRHEALLRGSPPRLQVTDRDYTDRSVLWQTVYDLPLGSDPRAYRPCASLDHLDAWVAGGAVPPLCPDDESHRGQIDVLCPWGFWGLSTLIEQPGDRPGGPRAHRPRPMSCLVVPGPGLEPLASSHLGRLREAIGAGSVRTSSASTPVALAGDLAGDDIDVAYFYCHCGYEEGAPGAGVGRFLQLSGYTIQAQDVMAWTRSLWPREHWSQRPPLVILNGCHTTEYTTRTLSAFVPAFTRWAGACGVIGTEITLHQSIANWVAEYLLGALWAGMEVGEAMRMMRWALLARGNVLGLAYTPHCTVDMALQQQNRGRVAT
jgi:hypothetical protein